MAKQYQINDLSNHVIHSIKEGSDIINFIEAQMSEKMQEMQTLTGSEWDKVCQEHYELVKWKREIQSQMGRMAEVSAKKFREFNRKSLLEVSK